MKKTVFLLLLFSIYSFSQQSVRVTYKFISNGSDIDMPRLVLEYSPSSGIARYTNAQGEEFYLDYSAGKSYQTFLLKDKSRITTIEDLVNYPIPEITEETATIHSYNCRKAKVVIRSNNIEIWYTTEGGFKGTPSVNIGPNLGLVLKIVRNGNFEIAAEKVELNGDHSGNDGLRLPADWGEILDLPGYKEKVTEDNFTTVKIFTDEKINFGDTLESYAEPFKSDVVHRFSKGTVIMKKIKLPENMQGHTVFAELTERSNGDAYDRTGSLFVIGSSEKSYMNAFIEGLEVLPDYKTGSENSYRGFIQKDEYSPPVELMRFITPFGIGHYNNQVTVKGIRWEDSVTYKQDITDIISAFSGEVWFGVFIGCYDKGGHKVSLKLKYHPEEPGIAQKKIWFKPIINTLNIMEASGQEYATIFGSDTLKVEVSIPSGVKNLKLHYISTGHGGWEHGDEFNKKMNEIFVDGKLVNKFIPWRNDCGMYRKYNPASGNFPNGISSSDYSRSGWCPGSTSVPVDIPLGDIKPGMHTFSIYIPMGKPEGTSFSAWNVSAVLLGEVE